MSWEDIEMGISLLSIALLFALPLQNDSPPQALASVITAVDPVSAKAGVEAVANGSSLGQDHVAALYLTDGKNDSKAAILEQTATMIRFRIPAEVKPGRYALMVLTKGKEARLIEEPVKITIEGEGPTTP
jgi:hypothetical protein